MVRSLPCLHASSWLIELDASIEVTFARPAVAPRANERHGEALVRPCIGPTAPIQTLEE